MTNILFALTGSDIWTLADGTKHRCGYWPEELAVPHRVFTQGGADITLATPGGVRPVPDEAGFTPEMNGGSAQAGQALRDYLESISGEIDKTVKLEDIRPGDYDAVFIPGGHGPMEDLAVDESFGRQLNEFVAAGKKVAAVCHGPAGLLPARKPDGSWLFAGYRLTGFSNEEETQVGLAAKAKWLLESELKAKGGLYEATAAWAVRIVVDRRLYTGQNPASSEALARAILET